MRCDLGYKGERLVEVKSLESWRADEKEQRKNKKKRSRNGTDDIEIQVMDGIFVKIPSISSTSHDTMNFNDIKK